MLAISLLLSATFALAAPTLNIRDVPISSCNASSTAGLLTANRTSVGNQGNQGFFFNNDNILEFDTNSTDALDVVFEPCVPNFGRFNTTGDGPIEGHLFLPDLNKCLGVADAGLPIYNLSAIDCTFSDDSSQVFLSWVQTNGSFLFAGGTQADGSNFQGSNLPGAANCSGLGFFGYDGSSDGLPPQGPVILECANHVDTFGFFIEA